jgi:hypothetical protein
MASSAVLFLTLTIIVRRVSSLFVRWRWLVPVLKVED